MKDLGPKASGHERRSHKPSGAIAATYDYRDESGALLFQVVRFDPKDFRQRVPTGDGGWSGSTAGVRRVPYHMPDLRAADASKPVYVVEGEKDADRLRAAGLVATCNAGGAGKWRDEYGEVLRGRSVVILPDNDGPGRDHASKVAASLRGKAASIKIVELPDLPAKGDVSDWLAAGGTIEALNALAANAPDWARPASDVASGHAIDLADPSGRTDIANSRRLAQLHGASIRRCEPWGKWLVWDGKRWAIDAERRIDAMAKDVAKEVLGQAGLLLQSLSYPEQRELLRFAQGTANERGVAAMISLARSEGGIAILPDRLDAEPWALNCANGTLDLRTGELREHDRADLLTKLCPTEYAPGAEGACPLWEQAVERIFGQNADLCGFVQRLLGVAIVGSVSEHILPIFWGDGCNGKSVLLETILDVLGSDYACKMSSDVLLASKNNRHPTEKADLHGKRLVVASETDDGRRLSEGLLKELTGGDTIKARRMREDFWEFDPSHTFVMLTNHRPVVRGTDHGIWRRLCLVPFAQTFWDADRGETGDPELRADKRLREKLRAEYPGILRWLVDGCLQWQRSGLREPDEVRSATEEYRSSQDTLGAFIADCCVTGKAYTAKASAVYAAYVHWCQENGEHELNHRRFGDAISERGIERRKSNGIWYDGLGLEQLEQWNESSS